MDLSSGKEVEIYENQGQVKVTDWNDMSTMFFTREEVEAMLVEFDKVGVCNDGT
ncbi:hypothetical protein NVP1032O_41 [Vibrio phage 1.032.O._10N.261.54.F5]|nr:hypothetical protein NVP1032O_41 [Vibrio phage 1.032.O._10N.261.54.F5]